jgi:hypothetical protein
MPGDPVELGKIAPRDERIVKLVMVRGEDVFDSGIRGSGIACSCIQNMGDLARQASVEE